jgi:hypothetical protein
MKNSMKLAYFDKPSVLTNFIRLLSRIELQMPQAQDPITFGFQPDFEPHLLHLK